MATRRMKTRRRRSCKNGKLKRSVRTKKGGKRRCKKRKSRRRTKRKSRRRKYRMKPTAPPMPENSLEKSEVRNLMEKLCKKPGVYEFVDMAGNSKFIDIFTQIKDEKASRLSGEIRMEPVYKRIERAFGRRVSIFRTCYPDISKILPENIPYDKLIFKGHYNTDVSEYNKKYNIIDYKQVLKGFQIFLPHRETAKMYSMKDYDELSLIKSSYLLNIDIPGKIATYGDNKRRISIINDTIKGQNILNYLNLYEDTECLKNSDDLIDLTDDFYRKSTMLTQYKYDSEIIPFREVVNGIPKYSPLIKPIDHFTIFYN